MRYSSRLGIIPLLFVLAGCMTRIPEPVSAPPAPSPPIVTPEPAPPLAAPSAPVQSAPIPPAPRAQRDAIMDATGLPPGPNRDVVIAACSNCHDTQVFSALRHPRPVWANIIADMQSRGLNLNQADYQKVEDYLATMLGPAS